MGEENIMQEFRFKNIDETNYFLEEIKKNELWAKSIKRFNFKFNFVQL